MNNPIKQIGVTPDGKPVLAGAFQMADTFGFPLPDSIQQATEKGCVISIPHYFASAIEAGWDDEKAFNQIDVAFRDAGLPVKIQEIKEKCIALYMRFYESGKDDAVAVATKMRTWLEGSAISG